MMRFFPFSLARPSVQVPVGSIVLYAGDAGQVAQSGWLVCDGRELACGLYPELFSAIGYAYGGAGKHFHVPDLGAAPQPSGRAVTGGLVYIIRYMLGSPHSQRAVRPPAGI